MSALLTNTLASFLLPPVCLLLVGGIGMVTSRWRPRLGRLLVGASLLSLWVVSTPAFNIPFLRALSWPAPADLHAANGAQAIVVLGGGVYFAAQEYGGADTVHGRTLERVRYAAKVFRETRLPLLVSGGRPYGASATEGELMKSVLENEFATPVQWVEGESMNTFENARMSARILREAGIRKVFLVTESIHMRRSVQAFAPTGIEVIPAPTKLASRDPLTLRDLLPSPAGFATSYYVAHELVGHVWYAIRERLE